jgi:hypothetical protein
MRMFVQGLGLEQACAPSVVPKARNDVDYRLSCPTMGGMDETARVIRILQHVHYCLTGFSITGFVELAKVPFKRYEEMTPQLIALDVFNIIGGCDVGG